LQILTLLKEFIPPLPLLQKQYIVGIGENSLYNCAKQQKDFYSLGKKSPFGCFSTLHTPKDFQDDLIF